MDIELTDNKWILSVPIAPNYTAHEAAQILGLTITWVRAQEYLLGPASSPTRLIDHDALVRYVLTRERKRKRRAARAQLKVLLEQHLGG